MRVSMQAGVNGGKPATYWYQPSKEKLAQMPDWEYAEEELLFSMGPLSLSMSVLEWKKLIACVQAALDEADRLRTLAAEPFGPVQHACACRQSAEA